MSRDDQPFDETPQHNEDQPSLDSHDKTGSGVQKHLSQDSRDESASNTHESATPRETGRATFGGRHFRAKRPPDCARCAGCGTDAISAYPTFSAGSGVAARPYSDDVICRKCGHIGPPAIAAS